MDIGSTIHAGFIPIVSLYITGEEVRRLLEITILLQGSPEIRSSCISSGLALRLALNAVPLDPAIIDLPIPPRACLGPSCRGRTPVIGMGMQYRWKRGTRWRLYHVVTDAYLLYFLPMVTDLRFRRWRSSRRGRRPVALDRIDELMVRTSR